MYKMGNNQWKKEEAERFNANREIMLKHQAERAKQPRVRRKPSKMALTWLGIGAAMTASLPSSVI